MSNSTTESPSEHVLSHLLVSGLGAGAAYLLWNGADWLLGEILPSINPSLRRGISWSALVILMFGSFSLVHYFRNRDAKAQLIKLRNDIAELSGQNRILREICGLTDLAEFLHDSKYEPRRLLEKRNILQLDVLGNGCSKWTREEATLAETLRQIAGRKGGLARFIIRDPQKLIELGHREKAVSNATSLIKLRNISNQLRGVVKLRIYSHVPAFRVTVINQHDEVIVGHYGGGLEDSKDTPLLVFENRAASKWGLNSAFVNLFENEWDRARDLNSADWAAIRAIAVMDAPLPKEGYHD